MGPGAYFLFIVFLCRAPRFPAGLQAPPPPHGHDSPGVSAPQHPSGLGDIGQVSALWSYGLSVGKGTAGGEGTQPGPLDRARPVQDMVGTVTTAGWSGRASR